MDASRSWIDASRPGELRRCTVTIPTATAAADIEFHAEFGQGEGVVLDESADDNVPLPRGKLIERIINAPGANFVIVKLGNVLFRRWIEVRQEILKFIATVFVTTDRHVEGLIGP